MLVGVAVRDAQVIPADKFDLHMCGTMVIWSCTFLRFFWRVVPRNPLAMSFHVANIAGQGNQIRRAVEYKIENGEREELETFAKAAAATTAVLAGIMGASGRIVSILTRPTMPDSVRSVAGNPIGPLTVFFWAPAGKLMLSVNNADLDKPTEKISLNNSLVLTCTGAIWTHYGFVISPINKFQASVNAMLCVTSGYQACRKIKADYT